MSTQKKQFVHKQEQVCKLSKKPINTAKDRYAIIIDCYGKEITNMGFYKQDLLRDLITGNLKKVKEAVQASVYGAAGGILRRLGIGAQKEVYDITGK